MSSPRNGVVTAIRRHRGSLAAALVAGLALACIGGLPVELSGRNGMAEVRGATPSGSPAVGGDTRSAGEGPGLVGSPVLAIVGVLAIGAATAGLTLVYLRLTGGRGVRVATAPGRPLVPGADEPESG